MIDKEELMNALRTYFKDGDVFEIRVLDAITYDYRREHVESGYFDYEHIDKVADDLSKLLSYRGAYVTVNPVNPDLLARAVNRLKPAGKTPTTSDVDILVRRWLLVDCDAVRPAGVSSSDDEHSLALAKAQEIKSGLASLGWSDPIMCDSGNGSQLMYRIELPTKDDGLVQKVLTEIAKCSSDRVHVDLSVHNPARIWRLPGTMNCKGDSIATRPHRMAKIIAMPNKLEVISKEQLLALVPVKEAVVEVENSFDLVGWISEYCPTLGEAKPWQDGRKWVFDVCPFNPEHNDKSAVLIEQANGAIGFRCHHNGCTGNDWHKLRELLEPPKDDYSDIDISGILGQKAKEEESLEPVERLFPNPGKIPENLMHIPGFVEEVVQLSLNTAPYPNRVLSFTGALSLLALLIGRKMCDKRDNRSNIYFVAVADSGTGKDHPRKVNFNIAHRVGVSNLIGDSFSSGEGLEDALFMHPSMLFQTDEMDCLFNMLKNKDARAESINEKLLKFYSASNTLYPMRKKALSKRNRYEGSGDQNIVNPNFVLFGTAVPKYFYEALSDRVLENGLVARCMIIEAGKRGDFGNPSPIMPSDYLLREAKYLADFDVSGNLTSEYPNPFVVPETPEATERLREVQNECDKLYDFFEQKNENSGKALWARAYEKICKLALLHGVSSDVYQPIITKKSIDWAWRFVKHLTERMLYMADNYVYNSVFDEKCKTIVRTLSENGGRMQHSKLLKNSKEPLEVFKKIIDTLVESEVITFEYEPRKTKPAKFYILR